MAAVEKFGRAYRNADVDTLASLLSHEYVHINGGSGSRINRDQWLEWVDSQRRLMDEGNLTVEAYEISDTQIQVHGNTAIVTGIVTSNGIRTGQPFDVHVRFTNVWMKENGAWRRSVFHDSPLPEVTAVEDSRVLPDSLATGYYDSWPGAWHRIDESRLASLPTFEVERGPGNSFLERWHLEIEGERIHSFGLRSWDTESRTWRLVWVADPDHFQIWDGVKEEDGWYFIRQFGEGSDAFLSRQAWILEAPDRLLRTIERSTDGGETWTTRYRDLYQRVGS